MENTLEDLVSTMEACSIDNKAEITNVRHWANSWRREFKESLQKLLDEIEEEDYHSEVRLGAIKHRLEVWIKEMYPVDKTQILIKLHRKPRSKK